MPIDEIEFECEELMEKAVDYLRQELRGVRTGRASAGLVDHLRIEVQSYGSTMGIRELASITTPDASTILIKPFDPTTIKDIERGIQTSDVGITPMSDGKNIRLPVPLLSGERRQQLVQQVKKMAEQQKVAVRNVRRDANKRIDADLKDKKTSEDAAESLKDRIQKLLKKSEDELDSLSNAKAKEIQEH